MGFKKITFRVSESAACPLFQKGDLFVVSGIAVLMDRSSDHSLVTTTVVHDPVNRQNCKILCNDFNRLIIDHERADLIPRGSYPCSGCTGTITLEPVATRQEDMAEFLSEGDHPTGLLHLLENFPFFSNIDRDDLEEVVKSFHLQEYRKNAIIIRRGDRGDNFYIILSGKVSVLNETGIAIADLGPGEVFGEMSLLSDEHASATVQAVEASEIMHVDNRDFKKILNKYPLLQQYFTRLLAKRLSHANKFRSVDYVSIMTGKLEELPAEALFQSLHAGRKTGILTITQLPEGNARFSFRQGSLIKAGYGGKKGKTAFYAILREKKGLYKFTPGLPPEDFDAPEIGFFMKLLMVGLEKADRKD